MNKDYLEYTIDNDFNGKKLIFYLREKLQISSRFSRKAAKEGRLWINDNAVTLYSKINKGDLLRIFLEKEKGINFTPKKFEIDVLFEDEDVLVVNKPWGIVVYKSNDENEITVGNAIAYYFLENSIDAPVRFVSRLDKDTSGVLLIAKNSFSHMNLSRLMQENKFEKEYFAIVKGNLVEKNGLIDRPIMKAEDGIHRIVGEDGKRALTEYTVIDSYDKGDLVRLKLLTGRTHQIRVHMKSLGHELFGDMLYGDGEKDTEYIKRQALHAYKLSFPHPRTLEIVEIKADFPSDLLHLIEKIK
ncbi:RluA family pseudouridine synthase [Clostridium sp. DL1XJH146]